MRTKIILVGLMLGASCSTSPTAIAKPDVDVHVVFTPVAGPDGSAEFTARLENETYTTPGALKVTLSPGTHRISGSFRGAGLLLAFATIADGGVKSGSLSSQTGPSPKVASCAITYSNQGSPAARVDFQMEFQVIDSRTGACGPPAP